jgi:hypothetical protein
MHSQKLLRLNLEVVNQQCQWVMPLDSKLSHKMPIWLLEVSVLLHQQASKWLQYHKINRKTGSDLGQDQTNR